ncbi:receptor-type tyrosine-protein phosphatase V-like [Lemur catta]|uniref:receptor-type tyrosine-protein phosphatase V-like n=1 Tax=Lemur catta TaxID=9447 RepID=UPI001E268038|nr:receptor-type tyrosine-protein phosphatase V-like [Lemur catta]
MRPPLLLAALLWLRGCPGRGPPPKVNVSSQGSPTSLFVSWAAPERAGVPHALRLARLSPLGPPPRASSCRPSPTHPASSSRAWCQGVAISWK